MKTEFKAKFLQHVAKKRKEEGFTLIELLVVIIIIGILSAIALPSFLNQANKAKQAEAKQYIGSINKGQQSFYTTENQFTNNIDDLGVGIQTQTTNYAYTCTGTATTALCGGNALNTASLFSYGGLVYLTGTGAALTSRSILCETLQAGASQLKDTETDCGTNMKAVK